MSTLWKTLLREWKENPKRVNIFANNISDKRMYPYHMNDSKFNNINKNNTFNKYVEDLNRFLTKEDTQLADMYMKWYSMSLSIKWNEKIKQNKQK